MIELAEACLGFFHVFLFTNSSSSSLLLRLGIINLESSSFFSSSSSSRRGSLRGFLRLGSIVKLVLNFASFLFCFFVRLVDIAAV
jgi:hypothetical protein